MSTIIYSHQSTNASAIFKAYKTAITIAINTTIQSTHSSTDFSPVLSTQHTALMSAIHAS